MSVFKVVAITPDEYEKVIYTATEKQVHSQNAALTERFSFTMRGGGLVIDPKEFPDGTRFMLMVCQE